MKEYLEQGSDVEKVLMEQINGEGKEVIEEAKTKALQKLSNQLNSASKELHELWNDENDDKIAKILKKAKSKADEAGNLLDKIL